ncbi:MAG: hypothetical protein IT384_08390 [Deltaproteobacteria bacterium]|nr:hypothetical protein [Deltaproteobacteria bacterium]
MSDEATGPREEEQNRPYRRFVGVMFALAIAVLCGLVLRGIVRHLDRMPSSTQLDRPASVDTRALRACAEDLDRLAIQTRKLAGRAFTETPTDEGEWVRTQQGLELERLSIVARCHLDESSEDPVRQDLTLAAERIEGLLRSYSLLLARHREDGLKQADEMTQALERAAAALRTR